MTDVSTGPPGSSGLTGLAGLTVAINTLAERVERNEADLLERWARMEARLDQIIEINRTVAVHQHRIDQHSDQIDDIQLQTRDSMRKLEASVRRLHERIDSYQGSERDRQNACVHECEAKIATISAATDELDYEVQQWMNRGVGAWVMAVVLMSVAGWVGSRWWETHAQAHTRLDEGVTTMEQRMLDHDLRLKALERVETPLNGKSH